MSVNLIVAVDQGNAIGWSSGHLPWRLREDMRRFKELTLGHTVVMGRTTYKAMGFKDGLPARRNYVLTRRPYSEVRGQFGNVDIVSSLEYFLPWPDNEGDLWIIGGASVYAEALERNMVDEIYVTQVHCTSGADVTLQHDLYSWKLFILREQKHGRIWKAELEGDVSADEKHPAYSFVNLTRYKD